MVVDQESIMNIMGGMESSVGVRLHNHRKKLRQRFDIRKKLGEGTYGKVQLGINKETGQEVAIKTIKKCKIETEADLIRIRREIQIMSSVQHPNIIHIYEVFENREKIVLVMEYAAGGELYDYLNQRRVLSEDEARRIFRQIATAVYYCHKHKICHRDLKLENILLDENGNAKIADFGLSNVFGGTRLMETYCGSPLYASPEIVQGIPYRGPEVDCWSLGVLLYTLVYGAMPFDGSHFKHLVKQISEADYFEPRTPSPASPLIGSMLCRSRKKRYDIVRICKHWWVNEGHEENCLDIAEHLASQTPVRLDLLLSLAPPVTSENVVVTKDMETEDGVGSSALNDGPVRSQSVDSIMKVDQKDQMDFLSRKPRWTSSATATDNHIGVGAKRELTSGALAEDAQGAKKKACVRQASGKKSSAQTEKSDADAAAPVSSNEGEPLQRSESKEETLAAALALVAELKSPATEPPAASEASENSSPSEPSVEEIKADVNDDVKGSSAGVVSITSSSTAPAAAFSSAEKATEGATLVTEAEVTPVVGTAPTTKPTETVVEQASEAPVVPPPVPEEAAVPPIRNTERRKSKIFETAEKFNNLAETKTAPEKNRKVFIPGVKVSDAKAAFERRSSLTPAPSLDKKSTPSTPPTPTPAAPTTQASAPAQPTPAPSTPPTPTPKEADVAKPEAPSAEVDPEQAKRELENRKKVKDAVDIIGRKLSLKKKLPPLAVNLADGTSSASGTPGTPGSPSGVDPVTGMKTVRVQVAPNDVRLATIQVSTPQATKFQSEPPLANREVTSTSVAEEPRKSSKVEITLKSATLPRRKTSQPEGPVTPVQPPVADSSRTVPRRASVGQPVPSYRSEVEHMVGGIDHPNRPRHQRSEVAFPVAAAGSATRIYPSTVRSASLEPESKLKARPREHIIPIRLEDDANRAAAAAAQQPAKPPVPPTTSASSTSTHLPYQRSLSARSTSLSRQSTQDSDTDSTVSASGGEPIRKSQREYIIPIAVEGGGYVTPRASSLEPGEDIRTSSHSLSRSRLSRPKRMSSLFSESDDERESLNSEDRRGPMDFHRLRSSRPTRRTVEHTDSLSSAEEEDDDEGFEILTAENLFSSLLSRVRSLTQRINVEDGGRPGFPASRLLNQLHSSRAGSPFWTGSVFNRTPLEPLSRSSCGVTTMRTVTTTTTRVTEATRTLSQDSEPSGPTPWRRSVSRDTSDTESVSSGTLPRGRRADASNSGDYSDAAPFSYSPSLSECLSAPSTRRSSRDLTSSRRYSSGYSSARRAARALEEELNQPATYNRRLGRTLSMRTTLDSQDKELPPLPYVPKRLSGYTPMGLRNSTDGMTMSCPASTFSSREESLRSPSLLRSTSLSREESRPASERLIHERPALERLLSDRRASAGITSERHALDRLASDKLSSDRLGPDRTAPEKTVVERPILERFLSERPVTESSTLGRSSKGRRISRFLRPDFYDTPRESSIYAKERDLQKAAKNEREPPNLNRGYSQSSESRIESTIRSLRESSLGPREMDGVPTESSLLRRAVSVSDFTPNFKTAAISETTAPRRIPSYRKYTGAISDTSLLLDQPQESRGEPTLIKSTTESSSSVTPVASPVKKRKTLSTKNLSSSSSGAKKQTAMGANKPLDVTKGSETRSSGPHIPVKDPTENKTDQPAVSTEVTLPLKSPPTRTVENESSKQAATAKVKGTSETSGNMSGLVAATLNLAPSKTEDITPDIAAASMSVQNGAKDASESDHLVTNSAKDSSITKSSENSSTSGSKASSATKSSKETPEGTVDSPKRVRNATKITDFSSSSLPKVPSLTKLSKNIIDNGNKLKSPETTSETNTTSGSSKTRSISKITSGSTSDVSRTSPTKARTVPKIGSSTPNTEQTTTSPTKLRSSVKAAGSSSDLANALNKIPSATKLNRSTADGTRTSSTLTKTAVSGSSSDIANTLKKVPSVSKLNRTTADSTSSTLSKTAAGGSSSDIANALNKVSSATKLNRSTADSTRSSSTLRKTSVGGSSSDIASTLSKAPSASKLNRTTGDSTRTSSTLPKAAADGSSSDISNTLRKVPSTSKVSKTATDNGRTSAVTTKTALSGSSSDIANSLSKVPSATKVNRTRTESTRIGSNLAKTVVSGSTSDVTNTLNKVPSSSKVNRMTTESARASSIVTKTALSGSSTDVTNLLSKVPSATKVNKGAVDTTRPSSSLTKTVVTGSSSDVTNPLSKVPSATKVNKGAVDTTRPSSSLTKTVVTGSSSDVTNTLSKVSGTTKVGTNAADGARTSCDATKTPGSEPVAVRSLTSSSPEATKKVSRPPSSLLPSGSSEKISSGGSPTPRRNSIKTGARKSDNDAKTNGSVKIRSSTESPSTSPTKRASLASLSPVPRKTSPPMPGQSSPRPTRRRNSVSQPSSAKRSSSQSRRGRSSSSVEPEDIPVISLKDVERRHRAMLLDRWSQSLQSLHLEREKAKAEAEAKGELKVESKPETKSEPKVEVRTEPETETCEAIKSETKLDVLKGKIPRRNSSQNILGETSGIKVQSTMPPKIPASLEKRPKTLSLKVNLSSRSDDIIMSPVESETLESPHSALTSPVSEDTESVSERIRRKSFYSRFNDVKKKKRSASSSLLPSYGLTPRTHYPTEYTRSLSCGITGSDRGRPLLLNGSSDEPLLKPKRKDRSPSWERSNMEIQNDLLFHNLGLHRFDPNNLSTDKETLFGMLSPTSEMTGSLLGVSNSSSNIARSDSGEGATSSKTKAGSSRASSDSDVDVVVTLPPPKPSASKT